MNEQYYSISLEDYAKPGFCSGWKEFFGTIDDVDGFIDELSKIEGHETTLRAFLEVKKGNLEATHDIAYGTHRFMEPVETIAWNEIELDKTEWDHRNIYGWIYRMRIHKGKIINLLVKHGDKYIRCYKVIVSNLSYFDDFRFEKELKEGATDPGWRLLKDGFWGHPAVLNVYNKGRGMYIESRFFFTEKVFDNRDDAMNNFKKSGLPNLGSFCDEIFGDG
jgi:hypothetical protein